MPIFTAEELARLAERAAEWEEEEAPRVLAGRPTGKSFGVIPRFDSEHCIKHGAACCYDCLMEHHAAESKVLIEMLKHYGCRCQGKAGFVCEMHIQYSYLFHGE